MKHYSGKKKKYSPRTLAIFGISLLVLLIVLTATFRVLRHVVTRGGDNFFYPYLKLVSGKNSLQDKSLLLRSPAELAGMVEELSRNNRELALQNNASAVLLEENNKLRSMLNLSRHPEYRFIAADIILRDPLRFREFLTISKGSNHGIKPGAAVVDVSPDGRLLLVGVVSECSARSAKVITIMDQSLRISGKVGSNNMVGFTNTGKMSRPAPGRIRIGMLPLRDDYQTGGAVMTTGFEKGIPADIKIGELHFSGSPQSEFGETDFNCELIPAVRFESLRFVTVINITGREDSAR